MLIYQALYFAQLFVFQGSGRFQNLMLVRTFLDQLARLGLIHYATLYGLKRIIEE